MRSAFMVLVFVAGCDRRQPSERSPQPQLPAQAASVVADAAPAPATAPTCTLVASKPYPQPRRLVAIGDIHGDLAAARSALRAAGAIDATDRWIGGDLVIVQTGDVLDRGDDEQAILDLFATLEVAARAAGGAVIQLNGNHELMNAAGDFRYVTPGGFTDFDDVPGLDTSRLGQVPAQARTRVAAFLPGGLYAKRLAKLDAIAIVGDTIFSHAGVLGDWVTQVDAVNRASRCWLDGQSSEVPVAAKADDGPLWTRAVGLDPVDCSVVTKALAALKLKRMVVGHTVQPKGITSACDGALWRIDVGLAKHYGGPIQVLEITGTASTTAKILDGVR